MPLDPSRIRSRRQYFGDARVQLLRDLFLGVAVEDARLRLDHLAERPVGDALSVGQTAALAPVDEVWVSLDVGEELGNEPGLSDPRHADERHELRSLLLPCSRKRVPEQIDLFLSPDERPAGSSRQVDAEPGPSLARLPDPDRGGFALRLNGIVLVIRDRLRSSAIR